MKLNSDPVQKMHQAVEQTVGSGQLTELGSVLYRQNGLPSESSLKILHKSETLSGEQHSTKPVGRSSHLRHCTKNVLLNISASLISQLKTPA